MQTYLLPVLIVILIPIIIEDFRHRKISLLWILIITALAIIRQLFTKISLSDILLNTLINFCIIAVNYGILTLYFSLRNKRLINLSNEYLGVGDLAFFISVAFLFSPVNFICFLLFSLLFTLLFALFARSFLSSKFTAIPLAGLQALFLVCILTAIFFNAKNWEPNNDELTLVTILNYVGIG